MRSVATVSHAYSFLMFWVFLAQYTKGIKLKGFFEYLWKKRLPHGIIDFGLQLLFLLISENFLLPITLMKLIFNNTTLQIYSF